jgi:putative transposase
LRLLPDWFDDYNENHPHKGFAMLSPNEFLRKNSA